jgi:N-methylhydantoinase B/oxoprolinase/acetone carboxylase alpha subunit
VTLLADISAFTRAVDGAASAYVAAVSLPWPTKPQAAIFDAAGEALSTTSVAAAGGLGAAVAAVRAFFGDAWQPGDVAITNDQDAGAATACEFSVVAPVCSQGRQGPVLWAVLRATVPDFGGWEIGGYSPQAVDRWAEGARFEAAKIVLAGRNRREVADMLMLNSRTPKLTLHCIRALATAASSLAKAASHELAAAGDAIGTPLADVLFASELESIDRATTRLARRSGKGAAQVQTPFPELALDPVEVAVVPSNDGMTVAITSAAIAPRPVNLAPGMAADIVTAAVGGALDLGALRTGALRRRIKIEVPSPSLAAAPLPAPVCLGRATTGASVFAATISAMADAGIGADGASLWRSYLAESGDVSLDLATGRITLARAESIRAREAKESNV